MSTLPRGINVSLHDNDSDEVHAHDMMKGSDYLGDAPAIETLPRDTPKEVIQFEHWGMTFFRDDDGIVQRYLAGYSALRTTYAGAETGHHLLHTMYRQVVKRGIEMHEEQYVEGVDPIEESMPVKPDQHYAMGGSRPTRTAVHR